jgi:hypothetical protein
MLKLETNRDCNVNLVDLSPWDHWAGTRNRDTVQVHCGMILLSMLNIQNDRRILYGRLASEKNAQIRCSCHLAPLNRCVVTREVTHNLIHCYN